MKSPLLIFIETHVYIPAKRLYGQGPYGEGLYVGGEGNGAGNGFGDGTGSGTGSISPIAPMDVVWTDRLFDTECRRRGIRYPQ